MLILHFADLPTPDMAWVVTPTNLILVVDRRVRPTLIVQAISLALSWIDSRAQASPPPEPAAAA